MQACINERMHTYMPAYLPTYLPCLLPTCLPTYLPACLPDYVPTYAPTYVPAYIHEPSPIHKCVNAPYLHTRIRTYTHSLHTQKTPSVHAVHSTRTHIIGLVTMFIVEHLGCRLVLGSYWSYGLSLYTPMGSMSILLEPTARTDTDMLVSILSKIWLLAHQDVEPS